MENVKMLRKVKKMSNVQQRHLTSHLDETNQISDYLLNSNNSRKGKKIS